LGRRGRQSVIPIHWDVTGWSTRGGKFNRDNIGKANVAQVETEKRSGKEPEEEIIDGARGARGKKRICVM